MLRWLRRVVLAVVLLWGAYVVAANAFLNLGGLSWVASYVSDVEMRVDGGWSWWPGRVVDGRGFALYYTDSSVEMQLEVPRFETQVVLHQLLRRTFETTRSDVHDVNFRLRFTRSLEDLCAQPRGLPSVEGRADPNAEPCADQPDPGSPSSDDGGGGDEWSFRMRDVHVHRIAEAWVERFRIEPGDPSTIHGAWSLEPSRSLTVVVHDLELAGAGLWVGEQEGVRGAHVRLRDGKIDDVDPSGASTGEVWEALTGKLDATFASVQLRLPSAISAGRPSLTEDKGLGLEGLVTGTVAASLEGGVFQTVTATLAGREVRVRLPGPSLVGALEARVDARAGDDGLAVRAGRVRLDELAVEADGGSERHPDARIEVKIRSGSRVQAHPDRAGFRLELQGEATSADPLVALVPGFLPSAALSLLVDDDDPVHAQGTLTAEAHVRLRGLVIQTTGVDLKGDLALTPKLGGQLQLVYGGLSVDLPL